MCIIVEPFTPMSTCISFFMVFPKKIYFIFIYMALKFVDPKKEHV